MSRDHDRKTLQYYADHAAEYIAGELDTASPLLAAFLARLPAGARILELGCGPGHDAAAMLAAGFDVDATDGSPAIAALASARIGRPVRTMLFEDLTATSAYDAIWASACLLHVPRTALPGVFARIFRALRPGGLHQASFKTGRTPGRDANGRYFNRPTARSLTRAYAASADWQLVNLDETTGGQWGGGPPVRWATITLRRPII